MNTYVSTKANKPSKSLWVLSLIIIAVGLFFAAVGLSEYYNVGIAGGGASYPFGGVNESQWYYQSENIYATYNLVCGTLFLIASALTIWGIVKKSKPLIIFVTTLILLFVIAELISVTIE
jgi:hypothetical protein